MDAKDIKFDAYGYFPSLRTRPAEIRGLKELTNERKDKIIPLLTLQRWLSSKDIEDSMARITDAIGNRPFFVDLTYDNDKLLNESPLRLPDNDFENWHDFITGHEYAIPVIQFGKDATTRNIVRQALNFEKAGRKVAFRIRDFTQDTIIVNAALGALDDPDNAMVFIDSQYIRDAFSAYVAATSATINAIRDNVPSAFISTLATSFPASVIPYVGGDGYGVMEIMERKLHRNIGGYEAASYGDYGSIHSIMYDSAVRRWSPRVDFPLEMEWEASRPNSFIDNQEGYVKAAKTFSAKYRELDKSDIWGERMIYGAANSGETVGNAPAPWISVRVNIHLSRQIDFTDRHLHGEDLSDEELEV